MAKMNEVIDALECIFKPIGSELCSDCAYPCSKAEWSRVNNSLARDALALLKAQEPVKAVPLKENRRLLNTSIFFTASCGNCNGYLLRRWKACPLCGRKVKWDE